ncbi:MAG: hypothetical protein ACTSO3_16180 [Candidatus Heimdallarchaeaceae archaeon]
MIQYIRVQIFAWLALVIFLILGIFGCNIPDNENESAGDGNNNESPSSISAEINIVNWNQDYYSWGEWSSVEINYEVKNTGSLEIDECEVWFTVTCIDDSEYTESGYVFDILPGTTQADYTYIYTADKEATSVEVYDYELTQYEW